MLKIIHNYSLNRVSILPKRLLCSAAISILLTACGGGGSGDAKGNGGIIGTGIYLEGTASTQRQFAKNEIEIKSRSGEKSTATIGNRGRFKAEDVPGEGPYLMRAATGNDEYLYSIGYKKADNSITQNVHSYTDAAARNWFVSNGLDIDTAFAGGSQIDDLPSQSDLNSIAESLQAIVNNVLAEYDLAGTDLNNIQYEADNTGVDLFLTSNPVLINNGSITIVVRDPNTEVLTQSSTAISLGNDLSSDDLQPPASPMSVRALAASETQIVLAWEAAVDNVGVAAYQVLRDGAVIATTPFPVYTDVNLVSGTQYSYSIIAIDSSGNFSAESIPAMSETLSQPDSVAPTTPLLVMLEPGQDRFAISWAHADIADIAAFNVYRTDTEANTQASFKVTSTFLTDATVLSGTNYCYQISALDASGNESPLTDSTCATTGGAAPVAPVTSTPVTPPASGPDPVSNGGLKAPQVDVSSLACTDGEIGNISANTVIEAGCYVASGDIRVSEPANLTLKPGVIIKFSSDGELRIADGASLTAVGTELQPIVLTSMDPTPGSWDGIRFWYSNSSRNQLDFVQIEYAGRGGDANVLIYSVGSSPSRISVTNTTSRNGSGYGFDFQGGTLIDAFEGNLMVGNNEPITVTPESADSLNASSQFSGNTFDRVTLKSGGIGKETRFAKLDVPYYADKIDIDNTLTIDAGVEVMFKSNGKLISEETGTLKAIGTAEAPILFTAEDKTAGSWTGLVFQYSKGTNQLEHVTIEYGGAGSNGANLSVPSFASIPSRISATNLTLRHSLADGFRFGTGAVIGKFDNITSTQNGRAGVSAADGIAKIGPGGSFMGNDVDEIRVLKGDVEAESVWLTHDVPYAISDLSIEEKLTLSPGTTIIADAGGKITITDSGALSAVGTPAQNIVFTGKQMSPGYWGGIELVYSANTNNKLSYAVVEYAGNIVSDTSKTGNIVMKCFASIPASLSIDNSKVDFSSGWGLYAAKDGCLVNLGVNVTFTGNGEGGFNLLP